MDAESWLRVICREYLDDFVGEGGAAVKFAVADEAGRRLLQERLREEAEHRDFLVARVDAVSTRLHLIDRLFHEVARQVDWDGLAHDYLLGVLSERGLKLPADTTDLDAARIAELNDYPEPLFQTEVIRWVGTRILRDYQMSQEFRLAMSRLCLARLDPGDDPALTQSIREWLRGELRLISTLKRAHIFQRVARHNARHMLFSLAHWLKVAGRSGLVLALDITRYGDTTRPARRKEGNYYSLAATLDAYEVLRQLIDATDELEHCFVMVLTGPEFLTDDRRGLRRYDALYTRIVDDVRDRYQVNPLSALLRLAPTGSDAAAGPILAALT